MLDERDKQMVAQRQAMRDALSKAKGPLVGDVVEMPDGSERRVTHDWGDAVQLTLEGIGGGSFYFNSAGYLSYSGALDSAIPVELFNKIGTSTTRGWVFHHDLCTAHNGVDCDVSVTRWRCIEHRQAD